MVFVLVQWLYTDDLERCELLLEEMVAAAETGGEDAVDFILAGFADDYRGSEPYTLDRLERYLRRYVAAERVKGITTGDPDPIADGSEIHIPLYRVTVELDDQTGTLLLAITFAKRDGEWKIINVASSRFGR